MRHDKEKVKQELKQGMQALGFNDNALLEQFYAYLLLLEKWNKVYNLTAVRDIQSMVSLHIIDSLSVLPLVKGQKILDIGTGAGLPAVIWALARPDLDITALDSKNKKIRFITQVVLELKINNVHPICERIEKLNPDCLFDCIVSRAYTDLLCFYQQSQKHLYKKGKILAMKGQFPDIELKKLTQANIKHQIQPLDVPLLNAKRHVIVM